MPNLNNIPLFYTDEPGIVTIFGISRNNIVGAYRRNLPTIAGVDNCGYHSCGHDLMLEPR